MAQVTVTDSVSTESGAMNQAVVEGTVGKGQHLSGVYTNAPSGSAGADTDVARALVPDLIRDAFDDKVVKMGFTAGQINAMTREIGYRPIKSMVYGYYSVDLRQIKGDRKSVV